LHRRDAAHAGIITRRRDPEVEALAARVHAAVVGHSVLTGEVVRIVGGHSG
jgi:hypothetical protein